MLTCVVVGSWAFVPSLWLNYIMFNLNEIHWNGKCSIGNMLMSMKRWNKSTYVISYAMVDYLVDSKWAMFKCTSL